MPDLESIGDITTITGQDVITDLLERVGKDLAENVYLRDIDSYIGYAARVVVEIQLDDYVDHQQVSQQITVGKHDQARPSRRFEIEIPAAPAEEVRQRNGLASASSSLERPVDASGASDASIRRWRAPRRKKA